MLLPELFDVKEREQLFDWLIASIRAIRSSLLNTNHGFARVAAHEHAGTAGSQHSHGTRSASSSTSELGTTITNRKRPRNEEDGSTSTEQEISHEAKKIKINERRAFACPFHQRRPLKYWCNSEAGDFRSCASPGFPEIQRVK